MQEQKTLKDFEDHWVTDVGAWFAGERVVFRGKDLFTDLKDLSWMGLLLYGITSRFFDQKQIRLFEAFWALCGSYPDPRLWNNRVAALSASVRSTCALGIGAATAVSEATIYGRRPDIRAIDFLLRTQVELDKGTDLGELVKKELKNHKQILGFGRPIVSKDERIKPIMELAGELNFADGKFLKLAFEVERILLQGRWRFKMNIASLLAALAADQGLSYREYYQFMVLSFSAGLLPCYVDALNKPEGTLFPLDCNRIDYQGSAQRSWDV